MWLLIFLHQLGSGFFSFQIVYGELSKQLESIPEPELEADSQDEPETEAVDGVSI